MCTKDLTVSRILSFSLQYSNGLLIKSSRDLKYKRILFLVSQFPPIIMTSLPVIASYQMDDEVLCTYICMLEMCMSAHYLYGLCQHTPCASAAWGTQA